MNEVAAGFSVNVLVIGKSGSGKSSLINYVYGLPLRKTGPGKPVTPKEICPTAYPLDNGLTINLYDTWGLEPDKADEWSKLIMDEVRRHEGLAVRDWFHTIIFCVSAKTRVQRFEAEWIRQLNRNGDRVLVALTHCDIADEREISGARWALREDAGIGESDIVNVSSVSQEMLSGEVREAFGRKEVIDRIQDDLWARIVHKVPIAIANDAKAKWGRIKMDLERTIKKYIGFGKNSRDGHRIVADHVHVCMVDFREAFGETAKAAQADAIRYYKKLREYHPAIYGEEFVDLSKPWTAFEAERHLPKPGNNPIIDWLLKAGKNKRELLERLRDLDVLERRRIDERCEKIRNALHDYGMENR